MRSDNHGAHYSKASISRMMDDMRKGVGEWGASQTQLRGGLAGTLVAYVAVLIPWFQAHSIKHYLS